MENNVDNWLFQSKAIPNTFFNINYQANNESIIKQNYSCSNWEVFLSYDNPIFKSYSKKKPILIEEKTTSSIVELKQFERKDSNNVVINNALIILFILIFIFYSRIKIYYDKYFKQFVNATYLYSESYKIFSSNNNALNQLSLLLNVVFVLTAGIFVFQIQEFYKFIEINPLIDLIVCIIIISCIILMRYIIISITGWILRQSKLFKEYFFNTMLFLQLTGILLLPVVITLFVAENNWKNEILYVGFIILIISYIYTIFRGIKIFLSKGVLFLYWILYLCTAEFLPVMLFYKILSRST